MLSTPERCVSRGSRSFSRSPPPLNLMDEQSQQHKSGNLTPEFFSQIVSSNEMPTSVILCGDYNTSQSFKYAYYFR